MQWCDDEVCSPETRQVGIPGPQANDIDRDMGYSSPPILLTREGKTKPSANRSETKKSETLGDQAVDGQETREPCRDTLVAIDSKGNSPLAV